MSSEWCRGLADARKGHLVLGYQARDDLDLDMLLHMGPVGVAQWVAHSLDWQP